MNSSRFISALFCVCLMGYALTACTEEIIQPGVVAQDYYPIIATNTWTTASSYAADVTVNVELRYLSYNSIKEINTFHIANRSGKLDTVKIASLPYTPAYSTINQCDSLVVSLKVPNLSPKPTNVRFLVQVMNQNGLFKNRATNTFTLR